MDGGQQMNPEMKQPKEEQKSTNDPQFVHAQEEFMDFYKKKLAQEEADRQLALKLMEQEKVSPKTVVNPVSPKRSELTADEQLALKLQKVVVCCSY